jgi:hypothetical protein
MDKIEKKMKQKGKNLEKVGLKFLNKLKKGQKKYKLKV